MAQIIITGVGKDQAIGLATTRKYIQGTAPQEGEYIHTNSKGVPSAFRRPLIKTKNFSDFQVNGVYAKEFEWDGTKTITYSIAITYKGAKHYISLGSNNLARSVVNSFLSLENRTPEELAEPKFSISFYDNQNGYGQASVSFKGEKLQWKLSIDEQRQYLDKVTFKGKENTDSTRLDQFFQSQLEELNTKFPHQERENGLDQLAGLDHQETNSPDELIQSAEELFGDDEI